MTRTLAALSLFLTALASASTLPIAPRDVVPDYFTQRGRLNLSAASNGSTFAVAWEDRGIKIYDSTASLEVRTWDASGKPEQPLPLTIAGGVGPAVVWSGSDWIVGSSGVMSRYDPLPIMRLFATRVDEHATGSAGAVEIASTQGRATGPAGAVANGNDLFIGNAGNAVITTPDLQPRLQLAQPLRPLAAAGSTFLAQGTASAVVISRDGAVLQNVAAGNVMAGASGGSDYGLVYLGTKSVEALVLSKEGAVLGRTTLETNVTAGSPAVIRRGDSYLAGWIADRNICFATFDATSKSLLQCRAAGLVQSLALADNGSKTLVAWSTAAGWSSPDHVYTSFGPSSQLPDLSLPSEAATTLQSQAEPRLVLDPAGVTSAWTDGRIIFLGGLDRGTLQTRTPRRITNFEDDRHVSNLRLSRSHDATLVLWISWPTSGNAELRGAIVPDNGSTTTFLTLGEVTFAGGEVASDGTEWLVAWKSVSQPFQILSTLITEHGIVVSPGGTPLAPSGFYQQSAAVASRGSDFLVSWTEDRPTGRRLMAIGISTSGIPSGGVMDLAGGSIEPVQLAASGRLYLIVVQSANIGFPVTSIIPDILVAGVPDGPLRVQPRDGGFAVLHGRPLRATFVDALGNDSDGGVLPFSPLESLSFDFVYDGPRLVFAHAENDGWGQKTLLEVYAPRMRATGMH